MAQFPLHPKFKKGRFLAGIQEYTLLANGLTVLLSIDRSAPVTGVMITYAVGSRNEKKGETGASHLLEHMMFKGSDNFNKKKGNDAWMLLERVGGKINATTWLDRTNYFEVVPKEHLPTAIQFEADRMRRAILTAEEFMPECAVVLNELVKYENEPTEVLDVALWAEAFKTHPYHHPTIGWKEDVEGMTVESLKHFYDTYYHPDNATLSVFGDIDVTETLNMIAQYFGVYGKAPEPVSQHVVSEPPQETTRTVTVSREGAFDIVAIGHKIPAVNHADWPALQVVGHALGAGKRSRLYQTLVETGLATEVTVMCFPFRDESLMTAYAFVSPGVPYAKVEECMEREFAKVAQKGISAKELSAAKAKIAAENAFSRDGVYALLQSVGSAVSVGDWTLYEDMPKRIEKVSVAKTNAVAKNYITKKGRTMGRFVAKK